MTTVPSTGLQAMKEKIEGYVMSVPLSAGLNSRHVFVLKASFPNETMLDSFLMTELCGNKLNVEFCVVGQNVYMWEHV